MKIVIVEDKERILKRMTAILETAGHEVCGVHFGATPDPERLKIYGLIDTITHHVTTIMAVAEIVKSFQPDILILDHELDYVGQDGKKLAALLGIPKERLLGISSGVDQLYCSRCFSDKEMLCDAAPELRAQTDEEFLSFVSA